MSTYCTATRALAYKAGALAAGLAHARSDVFAVFDAVVPPRDFLRRTVPHLLQPGIGVVQARWGHINRHASWLTRMQAILLDGHFVIEQTARDAAGCLLSFNGTCGVLRREAIVAAGPAGIAAAGTQDQVAVGGRGHG